METQQPTDATLSPSRDRIERRVLRVCEATGDFIAWWGFKSIHGRVWALLALSRKPLSQAEIGRTLGVSRAVRRAVEWPYAVILGVDAAEVVGAARASQPVAPLLPVPEVRE